MSEKQNWRSYSLESLEEHLASFKKILGEMKNPVFVEGISFHGQKISEAINEVQSLIAEKRNELRDFFLQSKEVDDALAFLQNFNSVRRPKVQVELTSDNVARTLSSADAAKSLAFQSHLQEDSALLIIPEGMTRNHLLNYKNILE